MKNKYFSLILKLSIITIVVVIDMLSKLYFQNYFENGGQDFNLIKGVLGFTYTKNTGGAFGIFSDNTLMLIIFSIIFVVVFFVFDYFIDSDNGFYLSAFSLILGGAIGNFIDRILLGHVRDFIQIQLFEFPVFNFADICLTVGVVMYFISIIFYDFSNMKNKKEKKIK